MSDTLGTDETPQEAEELDPEALASELDLGLDLSPEEQAEAEQMVAHLREQFGVDASEETEPAAEPAEPPEQPGEPEVEEPDPTTAAPAAPTTAQAPPSTRGVVVIDGVEIPVEEAVKYLVERERRPEAPKTLEPPEWVDREDPADLARWNYMQKIEAQQAALLENQRNSMRAQEVARATADAEAGIGTFRTLHPELSEEDITTLRVHAASLDIIEGLTKTRSGPDAIAKALDIAYWDHPEFRARATAEPTPAEVKKQEASQRKGKLNALAGGSGSAPRQEAKPNLSTDRAAKEAAAAWLKEQNIL